MERLQEINKSCMSSNNLAEVDKKANELNHFLSRSFEESDKAHELAFAVLLLEKGFLAEQRVELIREEKLFEGFAVIESNLNELELGHALGENSFASNYFLNIERFAEISQKFGFEKKITAQTNILDIVNGFDEKIFSHLPKKPFFIPIIGSALSSFIDFAADFFTVHRSIEAMKTFPSFEILETLNRFVGVNNSSIKK
ncbi:MAG: hypothetical protein HYW50_02950, partial [Candidatus Diapherotrites archaeon]|nr:hypothetical protein [Candidatus Diapherotrites archaeon]